MLIKQSPPCIVRLLNLYISRIICLVSFKRCVRAGRNKYRVEFKQGIGNTDPFLLSSALWFEPKLRFFLSFDVIHGPNNNFLTLLLFQIFIVMGNCRRSRAILKLNRISHYPDINLSYSLNAVFMNNFMSIESAIATFCVGLKGGLSCANYSIINAPKCIAKRFYMVLMLNG